MFRKNFASLQIVRLKKGLIVKSISLKCGNIRCGGPSALQINFECFDTL